MAVYAIGDVQGCYDPLQRMLDYIRFDPAVDQLWFCGDLVNRGGNSLETLRLIHSLRDNVTVTLGNHDLSLLAIAQRTEDEQLKVNPDLRAILTAPDREVLLDWLRFQKLFHYDESVGFAMVHAGLMPRWSIKYAQSRAHEVEQRLRGDGHKRVLRAIFGDRPNWSPKLQGPERNRAIINAFTRMRYCSVDGRIGFDCKGQPGTQRAGLYPWYEVPGQVIRKTPIVCGHWSRLGLFMGLGIYAIDTGCVWGGKLTALQLGNEIRIHQVSGMPADSARRR